AILGPAVAGYLALQRGGESAAAATAAAAAGGASTGKLIGLVAATVAAFTLVASSAIPSDASSDGDEPASEPAVELAAGSGSLADDAGDGGEGGEARTSDAGTPREVELPDTVVPAAIPAGVCAATMEVGDAVVEAEGGGDVTGAALLWNDEAHAVAGLDLPATTALLTEAVEGALEDTFSYVTDVTEVVETGACGIGSVLTQLPEDGVVQWVLLLAVDGAVDIVRSTVQLVEGLVDEVD
ncbi:hypothetical protein B7486_68765, partial [cyanobacterium TDX16]